MRILVVHNEYQHRGGEDSVVDVEDRMLRDHGNSVLHHRRNNHEVGDYAKLHLMAGTFWSSADAHAINSLILRYFPDVIHVHNTFPLVSPAVYWVAARHGIPVVQTLHNFRLLCPQAMFLREGRVCEDCLGHVPWRGAVRGCYRGSKVQSAVLASMVTAHRWAGTWRNKVTRYIALNDFCRSKFIEGGLPAAKIVVKPNFVDWGVTQLGECDVPGDRSGFLFVGRLSSEKGVRVLAAALNLLNGAVTLQVAGGGQEEVELVGVPGVRLLGALMREEVRGAMGAAMALVMPSVWYENFPMTLVEAFASGLPVIASRLGAMAVLIRDGETGLLFDPGNSADLAEKMRWALAHPDEMARMGRAARAEYEAKYTPEINYGQLMAIYNAAIAETKTRGGRA